MMFVRVSLLLLFVAMASANIVELAKVALRDAKKVAVINWQEATSVASDENFTLSQEEIDALIQAFVDPTNVRMHGLNINKEKFIVDADELIHGLHGTNFVVATKSKMYITVSIWDRSQSGKAKETAMYIRNYLYSVGY